MSKFKFELNRNGVRELLRNEDIQRILRSKANKVKNSAGNGYEISEYVGKNRANATISAKTFKAKKDNSKNNTLLKALNASKGDS